MTLKRLMLFYKFTSSRIEGCNVKCITRANKSGKQYVILVNTCTFMLNHSSRVDANLPEIEIF